MLLPALILMKIVVRAHAVACSLSIVGQNGWGGEGVHSFLLSSTGRRLKNITDGSNNMLREWKRERAVYPPNGPDFPEYIYSR